MLPLLTPVLPAVFGAFRLFYWFSCHWASPAFHDPRHHLVTKLKFDKRGPMREMSPVSRMQTIFKNMPSAFSGRRAESADTAIILLGESLGGFFSVIVGKSKLTMLRCGRFARSKLGITRAVIIRQGVPPNTPARELTRKTFAVPHESPLPASL